MELGSDTGQAMRKLPSEGLGLKRVTTKKMIGHQTQSATVQSYTYI